MRTALLVALSAGLLVYALTPQWRSYERMGERRFQALKLRPKEILVGVCWPFSANQDGMADGLQLAKEEINSGGLAGGIPLRLILRDDGFDLDKIEKIAIEFSGNPAMSAVIGYYDDSAAIKASTVYEPSRLLHLIVGANNSAMTAHGFDYLVRTTLSSDKIARSLATMLVDRGYRKFALIWEEDAYGEDLAYQFNVSLNSLNVNSVYEWSYSRDRADFRLPVNELKGVDADVVRSVLPQSDEATADELARARAALEHHGPARAPLEPARKRAFEFLVWRGYSTTVAYRTVREWSAGSTD